MKTAKIFIGIDPDVDKSGVAVWNSETKTFYQIGTLAFWELIEVLKNAPSDIHVVIEAGWLINKSNWHDRKGQSKQVGEKIAKAVGANHQVGKLIESYCIEKDINYSLVKPRGKVNAKTFKNLTKWKGRTNSEHRDAGMLVFGI